jgi:hypothetical protein
MGRPYHGERRDSGVTASRNLVVSSPPRKLKMESCNYRLGR